MFPDKLQEIYNQLVEKRERKANIDRVKANAELETIQRETDAYCDGVYDMLRALQKKCGGAVNEG